MSDLDPRTARHGTASRAVSPGLGPHELTRRVLADVAETLSSSGELDALLRGVAAATLGGLADHALVERAVPGRPPRRAFLQRPPADAQAAWALEAESEEALARCARRATAAGELVFEDGPRIAVPIDDGAGVVGAIALGRAERTDFDEDDVALVLEIARRTGLSLRAVRLLEAAEDAERSLRTGAHAQQALERADRRKDEIIAMLGHELRGPLAAIAAAVEVMERFGSVDPRVDRAREAVRRQVTIATRLADDLLDTSRIAQGKMTLRLDSLDLAALVDDVVEDHRGVAARRSVVLETGGTGAPVRVHGDRTRLAQALGNVLHNAIKFSDAGGRVRVTLASEGAQASVLVRDHGVGIQPELLERVFEPFEQGVPAPERAGTGGLGLGLALVRGVLELHGGRASAWSEGRGRGTEVRLELPALENEGARTISAPFLSAVSAPKLRVLVVEDDRDAAEMLQILLESDGHSVEIAANGRDAIDAAKRRAFDLVLCDLGLPGALGGLEVALGLRRLPGAGAMFLVALSGFAHDETRQRVERAGFDRHLTKPTELGRLRECVELAALRRASPPS